MVIASRKPLVGVRREVDGDAAPGRDRAGHLDVEHHLAVGAVGAGRRVAGAVDATAITCGAGDAHLL